MTGSRKALFELFSTPMYLPHGSHFQLTGKQRRAARKARKQNWQWHYRRDTVAVRLLARFGYAEAVDKDTGVHFRSEGDRRRFRNARKRERQAS